MRLKHVSYEVLALLPCFLPRFHEMKSKHADLRREMVWDTISQILIDLDVLNIGDKGFRYVV